MIQATELSMAGVRLIELPQSTDLRGSFTKTFHAETLAGAGICFTEREEFYSVSGQHVFRGMHFQLPPYAHQKLVHCISGDIIDYVLDLRKNSRTYGQTLQIQLSGARPQLLCLPAGLAHGFFVLSEQATVLYKTDVSYQPSHDCGIHWQSAGIDLPVVEPVISLRDQQFQTLADFRSPF